jgi:hypothetical protein
MVAWCGDRDASGERARFHAAREKGLTEAQPRRARQVKTLLADPRTAGEQAVRAQPAWRRCPAELGQHVVAHVAEGGAQPAASGPAGRKRRVRTG